MYIIIHFQHLHFQLIHLFTQLYLQFVRIRYAVMHINITVLLQPAVYRLSYNQYDYGKV